MRISSKARIALDDTKASDSLIAKDNESKMLVSSGNKKECTDDSCWVVIEYFEDTCDGSLFDVGVKIHNQFSQSGQYAVNVV